MKEHANRGFPGVRCILCGQVDSVTVHLHDVDVFHCSECGDEFTGENVKELMDSWQAVLDWTTKTPITAAD